VVGVADQREKVFAECAAFDRVFNTCSFAIVTPFDHSNAVNLVALKAVVDHVIKGAGGKRGVGSIIVSGSTGEQHSLTTAEKSDLFRAVVVSSAGRMPVVAGVAAVTTAEAVRQALAAKGAGCDGVMLGLPPYLTLRDEEFTAYVRAVVQSLSTEESADGSFSPSIPVLLYNNSVRNGRCVAVWIWI
jgi:4-hydroxy-tetrahydrodipicolinate synthase